MTPVATPQQLPLLLREPPWASGRRAPGPPRLALPPLHREDAVHWLPEERTRAIQADASTTEGWGHKTMSVQEYALSKLHLSSEAKARAAAGDPLTAGDFATWPVGEKLQVGLLHRLPEAIQLAVWNAMPASHWDSFVFDTSLRGLLARHQEAAIPGLLAYCRQRPVQGLRVAQACDGPSFAAVALQAMRGAKFAQLAGASWLLAHPDTAAQALLRQLFGHDDMARPESGC
jgi:hypothetical protein